MTRVVEASLDFVDQHGGVDGKIGIADQRAGRSGQMPRRGGEITAEAGASVVHQIDVERY